jgi:hypothetical protein
MTKDQKIQYQQKLNEFETGKITENEWKNWCIEFLLNDPAVIAQFRRMKARDQGLDLRDQEI